MKAVTGTRALVAALLLAGTALTGCSDGDGDGGGGDGSTAADAGGRSIAAYTNCMDGRGVKVVDGRTRTEGVDATTLAKAYRACRPSAPAGLSVPVTQWETALLTDFVNCLRQKGHQGYGDPDPRTGKYTTPKDSEINKADEIACLTSAEQKAGL
ncbi:hypothetical protein ACIQ9E_04685 [Streptomyces sp. NPDC094448]|uniref:hypothetical protein n=1 Tax=Streptomyces sp. NPDC094448 TaxID=3366063 RepID=UPI0038294B0E